VGGGEVVEMRIQVQEKVQTLVKKTH
jgi:hypothetical protein